MCIFGKFDFNFNKVSKLMLCYQYIKVEQFDVNVFFDWFINYDNNGIYFFSIINFFVVELNSIFGLKVFNNFIVGVIIVRDDCDFIGDDFFFLIFFDGLLCIFFGFE